MNLPPGFREIPDPEAEIKRLAAERAGLENVTVPRRDLDVLLAVATAVLNADATAALGFVLTLPGGFTITDVGGVVKRHGRRY